MKKKKTINKSKDLFPRIFISKAKVSNLKAFKGENDIKFAPMINLIFGKNSSGKSTINQALRLFRQSYGFNKLTPFNYESPTDLRGKGGLDIDVGYAGIVNNGDLNAKISLGVETSIYQNHVDKILENKRALNYTFKFKENFYTGKNLVKERTILSKINYSNKVGEITVNLPEYKFFEDKSDLGKAIRQGQRFHSGDFFIRQSAQKFLDDSIYKSVYHPYYYTTEFKPENLKIKAIEDIFLEIKKTDLNKKFYEFYREFLKYLYKKKLSLKTQIKKRKKKNEKNEDFVYEGFMSHRRSMEPLGKEVQKIRRECKGNISKQLSGFHKIQDTLFKVYDDQFIDFDESLKDLIILTNELASDVRKLINFFKKKKFSKEEFVNFFTKDICAKLNETIFFNGYFMTLPNIKNKRRNQFREQKGENYLINILSFLISSNPDEFREVNILNGYHDRFGGGRSAVMTDVQKAMDKFLVAPGLRQIPKRYFVKGLQTDYVGPSAENLGELLANPEINKATNKWFQKLEIPYKVDIQKSGNYYEIIFLPKNSKIKISSMHVGLGYPLILPFIVQCIIAKNKIILIEEPEVHLHPKIEADLADLIVESSTLRNNQFIIETHSEDFLLRILKSIRKEKLKPEHVSVNYITPNDINGSKINQITINKFGQYTTPWHDNLFAERRREFLN